MVNQGPSLALTPLNGASYNTKVSASQTMTPIRRPLVALASLGCKLNQSEVESLARDFVRAGCSLAEAGQEPDVFVVNTCTVTHTADAKARQLVREARRKNPMVFVVAAGCYAQRASPELRACGADLVVGNKDKAGLAESVASALARSPLSTCGALTASTPRRRTRALVKVQEGCHLGCAYCIVPIVRGQGRSRPVDEVVADVLDRVRWGSREVVLTGTEIGAYGRGSTDSQDLESLVRRVLDETPVERLRLSSLQPQEMTLGLLAVWQDPRMCRHIHMALQSGSDTVLKAMGRPYSVAQYRDVAQWCRQAIPDLALTTDVIVGFPGESEADFAESYEFCQSMGFARIHVFPYSAREGTPAARWPQVPEVEKRRRARLLLALAGEASRYFAGRFLGRTVEVLWEGEVEPGLRVGHTGNYLRVLAPSSQTLAQRIAPARLVDLTEGGIRAEAMPSLG